MERCNCPIFATASIHKKRRRQSTGQWEWEPAKAIERQWETEGSWAHSLDPLEPVSQFREQRRTTIFDATEAFLARCQNNGIADATLRKYRTFIKQLRGYCDDRGYGFIDQLTIGDMDHFYAGWKDGLRSKGKKLDKLKSFVKFCLKRKWLSENIVEDLEAPPGSSFAANKSPFSDEEIYRILTACDIFGAPVPKSLGMRPWGGEDAKDFILLSMYTGLRISDICLFDVSKRLRSNEVYLRQHKTKKDLFTWIPDWLVARLQSRQHFHGNLIFLPGRSTNLHTVTEQWRRRLKKIFQIAGPFEERPHPHRFRATFARVLLQKGVPPADVAELIGDTEAVLLKHYARFVPERQARLTRILREAFDDKPKPKLVTVR